MLVYWPLLVPLLWVVPYLLTGNRLHGGYHKLCASTRRRVRGTASVTSTADPPTAADCSSSSVRGTRLAATRQPSMTSHEQPLASNFTVHGVSTSVTGTRGVSGERPAGVGSDE